MHSAHLKRARHMPAGYITVSFDTNTTPPGTSERPTAKLQLGDRITMRPLRSLSVLDETHVQTIKSLTSAREMGPPSCYQLPTPLVKPGCYQGLQSLIICREQHRSKRASLSEQHCIRASLALKLNDCKLSHWAVMRRAQSAFRSFEFAVRYELCRTVLAVATTY